MNVAQGMAPNKVWHIDKPREYANMGFFKAIAQWWINRCEYKEHVAMTQAHPNPPVYQPTGMGALLGADNRVHGERFTGATMRIVPIKNGYLIADDNDGFASMVFCADVASLQQELAARVVGLTLEK